MKKSKVKKGGLKNKKNSFISKENTPKKEEVCEIFDVEKKGKKEEIKSCGIEEEKSASNEQMKKERSIFMKLTVIMTGLVLFFLAFYLMSYFTNHIEVQGVNFEIVKMGQLIFYKTSLPTMYNGTKADYNFYLRTDPRKLVNIPFDGSISLSSNMVLNMTDDFNCNGDGRIAVANVQNLYSFLGVKMIRDENASCDPQGRYMFLRITGGNKTEISEYGISGGCYNMEVNNCEILPATEKFMLDTLIQVNAKLKK